ncbi:fumarylacetoacetate hydrolase family protein [Saccharata proteae CBS 121410]|uniref:Fumarylacetoacetate hydrolase family protein n=1 Tax=Saccharata proteae CBS 121410 TaxID=1314787 RepID=A0A9P4HYE9_9PEZI|nr:fumarylacetoacetate hydrolase family protein [Saccharata proteae CBS 121410]
MAARIGLPELKKSCSKVVCIGRNYADHIKELNNTTPKQPFFFLKPPSSLCIDNSGEGKVLRPKGANLHYEVELGLVMGKTVRNSSANDGGVLGAIKGYLLAIDMTARNVQEEAKAKGLPWTIAKGFDTFCPISDMIEASRIRDPHNLHLSLSVNKDVRQSDNTNLMLFRIPRILSDISSVMTLQENDIVLTGTPKGVGPVTQGDVMTAVLESQGDTLMRMTRTVADRDTAE